MADKLWVAGLDPKTKAVIGRPRIVADLARVRADLHARGFVEIDEPKTGQPLKKKGDLVEVADAPKPTGGSN